MILDNFELPPPAVLGSRLQSARKSAGKTQEEAAAVIDAARTTITAIEKGLRAIRPDELVRLASFFGKSVTDLVRPGPVVPPLALQLRASAQNVSYDELVEPYAWELQSLCEDYSELERVCNSMMSQRYPAERSVVGIAPEQAAEDVAQHERNRLGLGDGPIASLRDTLEQDVGLRIFYIPMSHEVAAMFAFDQTLGGCIAVNQNHPEPRRRMSLAHEYAHFLTSRLEADVDFGNRYQRLPREERFAVAFAPAFLMPASGLSRRFNELKTRSGGKFTFADLMSLAHYFGVSLESLALRLEDLRLVRRGLRERLKESGFRPTEAKSILQLVERENPSDLLPTRYLVLALQGYRESRITQSQFARFLRVDLLEARRLLDETFGGPDPERLPVLSEDDVDRGRQEREAH